MSRLELTDGRVVIDGLDVSDQVVAVEVISTRDDVGRLRVQVGVEFRPDEVVLDGVGVEVREPADPVLEFLADDEVVRAITGAMTNPDMRMLPGKKAQLHLLELRESQR